ncbi:MAG TPA: lipid-A-disaccharide synthase N-terminal domain-containing protein, partial [Planctomycetota bacterium]|nr:lipid-A-disaccharide synthase N-terminal domain-containing protein [Planctomycetota bacterium]
EGEVEGHTADGIRVRPDADGAPAAVQEIRDGEIKSIEFKERESYFWLAFGLCGNLVWGSRFLYQWYVSEKAGKSVIPEGFWYISMVGSIVFLIFSIHLMFAAGWRDATPILLGYVFNTIPYARNLMLIHKEKKKLAAEGAADRPRPVGTGSPQDVEAARS